MISESLHQISPFATALPKSAKYFLTAFKNVFIDSLPCVNEYFCHRTKMFLFLKIPHTLPNAEHVEFRFMIDRRYAQRTFYAIRMTECGLFSYRLCNTGYCIVKYFLKISSSVNKVLSKCFCRIPVVVTYKLLISVC